MSFTWICSIIGHNTVERETQFIGADKPGVQEGVTKKTYRCVRCPHEQVVWSRWSSARPFG